MQHFRLLLIISLIMVSGLFAVYLAQHKNDGVDANTSDNEIANNDEDFFADNIRILKYKTDGSVYYEMQSAHITHNDTNDVALVTQPVMTLHSTKNMQWSAKADSGKVYNHQQDIDLIDNVAITKHEQNKTTPVLLLTTNNITLHPDSNTFTTSAHVNIKTETTETTATGMKANIDNNQIEMLNNVRTHYGK